MHKDIELARQALNTYLRNVNDANTHKLPIKCLGESDCVKTFLATIRIDAEDSTDTVEFTTYEIQYDTRRQWVTVSILKPKKTESYSAEFIQWSEYDRVRSAVIEGRERNMIAMEIANDLEINIAIVDEIIEQEGI